MPQNKFACFSYTRCGTHLLSDMMMLITGLDFYWPEGGARTRVSVAVDDFEKCPPTSFYIGHSFPHDEESQYLSDNNYKLILNMRDPRDQIISHYYYTLDHDLPNSVTGIEVLKKGNLEFGLNSMMQSGLLVEGTNISCMNYQYVWYLRWMLSIRKYEIPCLFINYESMVDEKERTIRKLADFLDYRIYYGEIDEIIEKTAFKEESETQKRRGLNEVMKHTFKQPVGAWKGIFTEANKMVFKEYGQNALEKMGYVNDDKW